MKRQPGAGRTPLGQLGLLALLTPPLFAASTQVWEMTAWQDYLNGKFMGVAISRDGVLGLAPAIRTLHEDGQSAVWSAARAPNGVLYLGTGHRGRIIALDPAGRRSVHWTAPEPEVFAVALDSAGRLYAATAPDGKIYRVERDRGIPLISESVRYWWCLAVGPDGTLYAGAGNDSGDGGRVYAIRNPEGNPSAEVWFDSGQAHITALAFDARGQLLAGSDPNGIIYRITGRGRGFVLYDGTLPEIRAIVPGVNGEIFVAALGGSVAKRAASATTAVSTSNPVVTAPPISITVEAQTGLDLKAPAATTPPAAPSPAGAAAPLVEITGVEKSHIVRIDPDGAVETLWSSKEENAYDLALLGGNLIFPTDGSGRIYELTPARQLRLLNQTNDGEIMRLIPAAGSLLAASANQGRVLALGPQLAASGEYESPVHDASAVARWGRLEWRQTGTGAQFRTRTGNSARPDRTWSEWSAPLNEPGPITSPSARYVQWKAEFTASGTIESVSVAYRPQNHAPLVKSITVASQLAAVNPGAKTAATPSGAAYSITVTDTGDSGASSLSGTATQNAGRTGVRQLALSWTAEDYDNDTLSYTLHFRGEGERSWKLLKTGLSEPAYTIDGDTLADGRYYFRVTATDAPANPPAEARQAELISAPVRIDHTPPAVTLTRQGSTIVVRATDATSPLRRCEMSLDAQPWMVVESEDGVTDSVSETFRLELGPLTPGEHLLTVRVTDAAGNAGLAKMVID